MSKIKIEAFLSNPQTADDISLTQLLKKLSAELTEKLQIIIYSKEDDHFNGYNLASTPALVIGDIIKIAGFCPSEESIISALKDLGL
jgi:hypothetical protein